MAECRVWDRSCHRNWSRLKASWNRLACSQTSSTKKSWAGRRSPQVRTKLQLVSLLHCRFGLQFSSAHKNNIDKKEKKILKITRLSKAASRICLISLVAIADMFQAVKHVKRMSWEFPFWKLQTDRRCYTHNKYCHLTWWLRFTRHLNLSGEHSEGLIWHIEKHTYTYWELFEVCLVLMASYQICYRPIYLWREYDFTRSDNGVIIVRNIGSQRPL